jgi:hypothetical protein
MADKRGKRCSQCGRTKNLSAFFEDKRNSDGRHSECKECTKAAKKKWDSKRRSHTRRYARRYYYAHIEDRQTKHRIWSKTKQDKRVRRELSQRMREKFPGKMRVRKKTAYLISIGKITKENCSICGRPAEAHHLDYRSPYRIKWLCAAHHREVHRKYVPGY